MKKTEMKDLESVVATLTPIQLREFMGLKDRIANLTVMLQSAYSEKENFFRMAAREYGLEYRRGLSINHPTGDVSYVWPKLKL